HLHTGECPYKCQEYGKSLSISYYLIRHLKIHPGEQPYKCLGCGRRFQNSSDLIRHQDTDRVEALLLYQL
ncbi:ZSC30 protein, partial [Aegithalos caudatus]|nr:ZSC30 protein [Aegithalos caudatus]